MKSKGTFDADAAGLLSKVSGLQQLSGFQTLAAFLDSRNYVQYSASPGLETVLLSPYGAAFIREVLLVDQRLPIGWNQVTAAKTAYETQPKARAQKSISRITTIQNHADSINQTWPEQGPVLVFTVRDDLGGEPKAHRLPAMEAEAFEHPFWRHVAAVAFGGIVVGAADDVAAVDIADYLAPRPVNKQSRCTSMSGPSALPGEQLGSQHHPGIGAGMLKQPKPEPTALDVDAPVGSPLWLAEQLKDDPTLFCVPIAEHSWALPDFNPEKGELEATLVQVWLRPGTYGPPRCTCSVFQRQAGSAQRCIHTAYVKLMQNLLLSRMPARFPDVVAIGPPEQSKTAASTSQARYYYTRGGFVEQVPNGA